MKQKKTPIDQIEKLRNEICLSLHIDPECPPIGLNIEQTSKVIGVTPGTLNIWRTTGRYNLPFIKMGHLIRYQIDDIAAFIIRRTRGGNNDQ